MWLRWLVSLACVSVIAGVGYFVLMDRQDRALQREKSSVADHAADCARKLASVRLREASGFRDPTAYGANGRLKGC